MGDWGAEPWQNDEAADWFHKFWKNTDFNFLINEIKKFDPKEERYDSLRSAAYLLQTLGITFVWPVNYSDELKPLLIKTISILQNMIDLSDDDWGFLDMWGDDPNVIESVQKQIEILKTRLNDLA